MSHEIEELLEERQRYITENAQLKMQLENVLMQFGGKMPVDPDLVGYITIKHMVNGGLQTSGHLSDLTYALKLLEHAREAIVAQHKRRPGGPVLYAPNGQPMVDIPNRDVDVVHPHKENKAFGDIPAGDRADVPPP